MMWLAGVDGCHRGWFRIARESDPGELAFQLLETAAELISARPVPPVIALDMPIGLPKEGPRECDRLARRLLGLRGSSVFPAPIRPALDADHREEASRVTQRGDGRRMSCQAWNLVPKSLSQYPLGREARAFGPISALRNLEVATATPAISRLDLGPNARTSLGRGDWDRL